MFMLQKHQRNIIINNVQKQAVTVKETILYVSLGQLRKTMRLCMEWRSWFFISYTYLPKSNVRWRPSDPMLQHRTTQSAIISFAQIQTVDTNSRTR